MKKIIISILLVLFIFCVSACDDKKDMQVLKDVYEDYFEVGIAMNKNTLQLVDQDVLNNFSSVTAENELKWESIQPTEGNFVFTNADALVNYAKKNDMVVRGHTLLWHSQTPSWVFRTDLSDTREEKNEVLYARLDSHMETVIGRFKDDIYIWDVANEVMSDNGNEFYRADSGWYTALGSTDDAFENFLTHAFIEARELDSNALLFYNDYNLVADSGKRARTVTMIENLIAAGAPIDGVGFQMHVDYRITEKMIQDAIDDFAHLDIEINFTEVDVSCYINNDNPGLEKPTSEMLSNQADAYERIYKVARDNSDVVTSVTVWGVIDAYTWLDSFPVQGRKNWPLLFDVNGKPKESYYRICEFEE